jgi:hypothetical protein
MSFYSVTISVGTFYPATTRIVKRSFSGVCFRSKIMELRLNFPENRFPTPSYFGDYEGDALDVGLVHAQQFPATQNNREDGG